jgi:EAL domain-containing protein (putative c-di-GMP-specific phosphodiesterase class I)
MEASLDRIAVSAGTLLFGEGDIGSCAYLISSGRLEIFLAREGHDVVLATRGRGEIVGEMAIIDNRPRSASVRVLEDSELLAVTAEQIAHRIAETDPILRMCLGVVIARYRETLAMLDAASAGRVAPDGAPASCDEFKSALNALSVESELRRALQRDEFELFFQPIVRLPTRRLAGFEALLRWRHPSRGLVEPGEFIPIAEASGLIVEMTAWTLMQVGRVFPAIQAAGLRNAGAVDPLFMSVNISSHDLARPTFVDAVARALEGASVAASNIMLEITESVLMKEPLRAIAALRACRELGLGIAIDDFGTRYSSLSYLSALPITTIKIDRSFVRSMTQEPTSRKIIQMILRLAEELDRPVVAEGIEYAHEERLLADFGCAFAQGYLFGRPAPLEQTLALARAWQASDQEPPAKLASRKAAMRA